MPVMSPEELLEQFQACTLPKPAWTHEAHLTVGLGFLYQYNKDEAICYMRSGIITYNQAVGTPNTPHSGYHETLSLFWMEILSGFCQKHPQLGLQELCAAFLKSPWADRQLALQYYSRDRLFSVPARARWLEPDLAPLDLRKLS